MILKKHLRGFRTLQSWKQILLVSLWLFLLVLIIFGFLLRTLETRYLMESAKGDGALAIRLLASSTIESLITEDIPQLSSIASDFMSTSPDIHFLRIVNEEGIVLVDRKASNLLSEEHEMTFTKKISHHEEVFGTVYMTWSLDNALAAIRKHVLFAQLFFSVVLVILSLLSIFFTRKLVIYPIRRLHHQVEQLRQNPDAEIDSFDDSFDDSHELGVLSQAVNQLKELLIAQRGKEAELEKRVRQRTKELGFRASHDMLTGLKNRFVLEQCLTDLITPVNRQPDEHCLLYMDLDQFKVINDTCGHVAGDALLKQVGHILKGGTRNGDTLARIGGDEFALLLLNCTIDNAGIVASNIIEKINGFRFCWDGHFFCIGISIGIASIHQAIQSKDELMSFADIACYSAKELGRNRFHIYHESDEESQRHQHEMRSVSKIRDAIDNDLFCLYQQNISLAIPRAQQGLHYEILVRMKARDGTIIPPGHFLPAAERYHLAQSLDYWVVEHSLQFLMHNPMHLARLDFCSINLSGRSFGDGDFLCKLEKKLLASQLPLNKICFEITETAAVTHFSAALDFIAHLKKQGCRFALDDFGTGMSSFSYLKQLPVDFLKIDGSFVTDIISDPVSETMVRAINQVAHAMGMQTIAEFVENEEIWEKLKLIGVDYVQGYGIAKPVPIEQLSDVNANQ